LPAAYRGESDASIEGFTIARSALLIHGAPATYVSSGDILRIRDFKFGTGHPYTRWGAAAAIDARGYFLTAAHCVQPGPVYLYVQGRVEKRLYQARIVWAGQGQDAPDLALIYVPTPGVKIFDWADLPKPGDSLLGEGTHFSDGVIGADFFWGEVREVCQKSSVPGATIIYHDGPAQGGDSGGPVLSKDGRLIGINTDVTHLLRIGGVYWKTARTRGVAIRPESGWLQGMIERDADEQKKLQ
jgi:S1-C subfamily serine protease